MTNVVRRAQQRDRQVVFVVRLYDGVVAEEISIPMLYAEAIEFIRYRVEKKGWSIDSLGIADATTGRLLSFAI